MTFLEEVKALQARCAAEEAVAKGDLRPDEAVFARIRGNVYGVCATVYGALKKARGANFAAAYDAKLRELERTWSAAWDQAAAHDDPDRTFTEDVKLAALRDVLARWEEAKIHDGA